MSIKPKQKYQTCFQDGCKTRPCFNNKGEKIGLYCSKHKLNKMKDVKNKGCQFKNCNKHPI